MLDVKTVFDPLETRCPRLGGPVPFDYCRKLAGGLPCSKALLCWELLFPVEAYMSRVLTPAEWQKAFFSELEPRLSQILRIARQAMADQPAAGSKTNPLDEPAGKD
jgi:hypothetical protein